MAGKNTMRLDKLLTMLGEGTRAQVKDYVRAGRVTVDGVPARDSGMQVDAENARIIRLPNPKYPHDYLSGLDKVLSQKQDIVSFYHSTGEG